MDKREMWAEIPHEFRFNQRVEWVHYGEDGGRWESRDDGGMFIDHQYCSGFSLAFLYSEMGEYDRIYGDEAELDDDLAEAVTLDWAWTWRED